MLQKCCFTESFAIENGTKTELNALSEMARSFGGQIELNM